MASYFCSLPLNFGNTPTDTGGMALSGGPLNMQDGNPATYWSSDTTMGSVRFPLGTSSVSFDAYYLICENLASYTATGLSTQSAPKGIAGDAAAADTIQYVFHPISSQVGTSSTFSWTNRINTGVPLRIYEFYVLKRLFDVSPSEGFRQIQQGLSFRGSQIQEALDGTRTRTRPLGNTGKWRVAYEMNILRDQNAKVIQLNQMFFDNPNFTHIVDFPTHPDRVYTAYLSEGVEYSYISSFTGAGSVARFAIEQQ